MSVVSAKPRYEWVDYSKGICMFAIVTLYSANATDFMLGDAGWMQWFVDFARPFRMPDFFLISGLFLARVIDRPWRGYLDKKVIHYSYFFFLWSLINLLILIAIGEVTGGLGDYVIKLWAMVTSWPFHMLWFIQMLPAYFLFTKLSRRVPVWIMLPFAAVMSVYSLPETNRMIIDAFWERYVFFYVGYIFAPYFFKLAAYVQRNVLRASIGIVIWGIINEVLVKGGLSTQPLIALFLGLAGATAILVLAALAEKSHVADWIRYLGEHSIVVYLAFYWPMKFSVYILAPVLGASMDHGLFVAVITIIGLLGSLSLYWLINWKTNDRWLFRRPRWAAL
jgi:uncharacterized membrane protein YcfT